MIFYKQGSKYKVKANKVAFELGNAVEIPDDKVVLHRNMNSKDFRLQNLSIVHRPLLLAIKEAYKNLSGGLKLVPHAVDAFCYKVVYREDGKDKQQIVQDVVVAKKLLLRLQLKFAKLLSKYCVFD